MLPSFDEIMATYPDEIESHYYIEMRRFLLDYALQDPYEWQRLQIRSKPSIYPPLIIRGPVPTHASYNIAKQFMERRYFCGNPILIGIRKIWYEKYRQMYILPFSELEDLVTLPLDIKGMAAKSAELCQYSRRQIEHDFMADCADLFIIHVKTWERIAPQDEYDSQVLIDSFFNCVATLMMLMMRELVVKSLEHVLEFMTKFQVGNNFGDEYADMALTNIPLVQVFAKAQKNTCNIKLIPNMNEVQNIVTGFLNNVLTATESLPRVEMTLFPELDNQPKLTLTAIPRDEPVVLEIYEQVQQCYLPNISGCEEYLKMYDEYCYILNGEAERSLMEFFNQDPFPYLKDFGKRIEKYEAIKNEIIFLRRSIPLNLVSLECGELNDALYKIIDDLRVYIVKYFVKASHDHNRSICNMFDEMSQKVSETPETVADLVALMNYVIECRDVTMFNIREKIRKTAENISFLMQYAHLTREDIQLNVRVFVWPKDMENVIDLALQRLNMKREQAEQMLRLKRQQFDKRLKKHEKLVVAFKKKDPAMLTMDEMLENTEVIEKLVQKLMDDKADAEEINLEETLLDFEVSRFTSLYQMIASLEPFDKLWHTVLGFHEKYETWYYGPFEVLDADAVAEEIEEMWRILYKLGKSLHENAGARRVAEIVRAKVEKFRTLIPVLQTVCNKGLQERHWDQIRKVMNVELPITPDSSLSDMIDAGMTDFIPQLEEISAAASKEYALEISLMKMKEEWLDVCFELVPYRETGVSILAAIDDIQVLLDDHILKAQTMRGSPYVKPFEADMQDWESKLVGMQDILEQWLMVQSG